MQLSIKPHSKNTYPLHGILIRGIHPEHWISEIERMNFDLESSVVYPLPNTTLNSVWGCLVLSKNELKNIDIGKNESCQFIDQLLLIPEKAVLYPNISSTELDQLLLSKKHLIHPDFGMVELFEPLNWGEILAPISTLNIDIKQPAASVFIPKTIKTFQVYALSPEEMLEQLEKSALEERKKFEDKPLNPAEKARLFLLKKLFEQHKNGAQDGVEKKPLLGKLESLRNMLSGKQDNQWSEALQKEYEALQKRNQNHLDKLMDLLKEDPEEALKYAIPLDESGAGRGGTNFEGTWNWSQMWSDFSLFGNNNASGGAGGTVFDNDAFYKLQAQYHTTAKKLIEQGKYRKAAFVYMKLLKNYHLAAETLEAGKLYQEAASVYLKYCNNKEKAAACYRTGNMPKKAIELYLELEKFETVGDIYMSISQQEEAFKYYDRVVTDHANRGAYIKAALLCKNKMNNHARSQELLLEGWRQQLDAFNCLNNYFENIPNEKLLQAEINRIYAEDVHSKNQETFLKVIKYEFKKSNSLAPLLRNIAFEIIAQQIKHNPSIVAELRTFSPQDKMLAKDILRYRLNRKKK